MSGVHKLFIINFNLNINLTLIIYDNISRFFFFISLVQYDKLFRRKNVVKTLAKQDGKTIIITSGHNFDYLFLRIIQN